MGWILKRWVSYVIICATKIAYIAVYVVRGFASNIGFSYDGNSATPS